MLTIMTLHHISEAPGLHEDARKKRRATPATLPGSGSNGMSIQVVRGGNQQARVIERPAGTTSDLIVRNTLREPQAYSYLYSLV